MKLTIDIEDGLLDQVAEITDVSDPSELVELALRALMHRDASRKLANLGGTMPELEPIPRRRPPDFTNP